MVFDRQSDRYNLVDAARESISEMLALTMGGGEAQVPIYFEANDPDVPTISRYAMPCFVVIGPDLEYDITRRSSDWDKVIVKDIPNLDAKVYKPDEPWNLTFEIETHSSDPENDARLALFMMRRARDVRHLELKYNKDEQDELYFDFDAFWLLPSGDRMPATGMVRRRWLLQISAWLQAGAEAVEDAKLVDEVELVLGTQE